MQHFKDYIEEVFSWCYKLKAFLQDEKADRQEVWVRIDQLTELLEMTKQSEKIHQEDVRSIQFQVEQIHNEIEEYLLERRRTGAIFSQSNPSIEAGKHSLPPLPYSYDALEPYISEEIMRLHHTKHHQAYVNGLNKAEQELAVARKTGDFSLVKHWSRELAFHGSGHYLHTIFWNNMTPKGTTKPSGKLLQEIEKYFGSFDQFKRHFTEAANAVEGVGWALLVWSPRSRHLEILQSERHMILTQWDTIPLLVLDVWEHAYYLQYKNNRSEYVRNWWNIVNWKDVEERFQKASQLKWNPY